MDTLSRSPDVGALRLLAKVFTDLPKWGYAGTTKARRIMIRGLCVGGRVSDALKLARNVPPNEVEWFNLLDSAVKRDPSAVDPVLEELKRHRDLTPDEYAAVFRHLRYSIPDAGIEPIRDKMVETLRDMRAKDIRLDRNGGADLAGLQVSLGDLDYAQKVLSEWDMEKTKDPKLWNLAVELEMARATAAATATASPGSDGDDIAVRDVVTRMINRGVAAPQRALAFFAVRHLSDTRAKRSFLGSHDVIAAIDHAEKVCRTDASATVWAEAIRVLTLDNDNADVSAALDAYAEARHRGVVVNVQLAQALIIPLCNASPPQVASAMGVYADLTSEPIPLKATRDRDRLLELYTTLLRAASRAGSLDIATRLIKDLRARSLPLPPSGATSILIAIMRTAPDHHAAFGIYAHFHALNGARLSANDYSAILACFLDTKKQSPFAPPKLYLEIVQDMRRSGFRPDSQVLASLLRSYGARATGVLRSSSDPAIRASHLSSIHKAIKDLHIFLRLDELVEVDVPLLNALMDAYSRVGAYTSAFEVWGELVERRSREDAARVKELYGPSISIALDTCARSDQLGRARRIWAWARHHGLDNPHTWDTWVECLCRLGKLDEAVDVVCTEMKIQQAGAPRPTKDTLEVLLRFAWSREDLNDVPRRVMQDFPEMWEDVGGLLERKVGRLLQARKERGMEREQERDEQQRKEDELGEREDVRQEQLEQVLQRLAQAGKRGTEAK